ncbi:MAG: ABC transporter ATP-binding protein [Rhodococcus sp. (in: high G+C Gram-positive bacteria)]|uniref:ATP-binding cassette domain-containing protein n=1 Tax=Rhodococcus sp. TaxID=1831 RepID=UPI003BB7EE97
MTDLPTGTLLRVRGLAVAVAGAPIVTDVGFDIRRGEVLGLVGASGSGKSMTCSAVMGMTPPAATVTGSVEFDGIELTTLDEPGFCRIRGSRIALVAQDPLGALTPTRTVGSLIVETVRLHRDLDRATARRVAIDLLRRVELPDPGRTVDAYPHELSGGMRQRVCIALAIAGEPDLIIADEPTSALDTEVGGRILTLFENLLDERNIAMLLISHDDRVVARLADRVVSIEDGRLRPHRPAAPAAVDTVAAIGTVAATSRRFGPPVLEVQGLTVTHAAPRALRRRDTVVACRDVSLTVEAGEAVALVGPSGSGKSSIVNTVLDLRGPEQGRVAVFGRDLATLTRRERATVRERMQAVFQDPGDSLDPRMRVDAVVAEPLRVMRRPATASRIAELLGLVGLAPDIARRYPRQLSGGQQQRVAIARALAPGPELLLLDEPVSSLDAPLRTEIMTLLDRLRDDLGLAYLMVSHDLPLMKRHADRIVTLPGGRVMAPAETTESGVDTEILDRDNTDCKEPTRT